MKKIYRILVFVLMISGIGNLLHAQQITQSAPLLNVGCPDTFSTTLTGSMYYWYFGSTAITPVDSGPNLQSAVAEFKSPGNVLIYVLVQTVGGLVKDSLYININPSTINVSLNISPDTICQGSQVTLSASPTGYTSYSFFIDNVLVNTPSAANTFNTSAFVPGDSVYVIGYNGSCYTNPSATIHPVVHTIPSAAGLTSTVPSDTICSGDTVTFTASPAGLGQYYFYVGGSLQQSSTNNVYSTSQLYNGNVVYIEVKQNGCLGVPSVRDTFVVHPTPFVTLSPATDTICQGVTANFSATSSVGGSTFNFYVNAIDSQSSTQSTFSSSTLNNGDVIYVTASAIGCLSKPSNAVDMVVNSIPPITLTSSAAPSDSICQGTPITFTVTPATDSNFIFFNLNAELQNSSSATYTTTNLPITNSVYVEAQNKGCLSYSDTIVTTVIPGPVVNAGAPTQSACLNSPVDTLTGFTPPGGTWSGHGVSDSGVFTPSAAGVGIDTLVYTYVDTTTGCPGAGIVAFTVNALPNIGLDSVTPLCIGRSTVLNAGGGTTYSWSPATDLSSTTVANPTTSTTVTTLYTVIVTNSNNCTDTATTNVVVSPNPTAAFIASDVCQGAPVTFLNNSTPLTGLTYSWNFGDGDTSSAFEPTHDYGTADSFTVTLIVAEGGCTDTATNALLVYPSPVANFEANELQGYNDSTTPITFINRSTNSNTWQWNFGDNTGSSAQSPLHVYSQQGVYSVSLVASNQFGCTDSISKLNYISIYPLPKLYIPNVFSPNGDGTNDILLVNTTGVKYFEWTIFNRWGEKVFQSGDILTGWDGTYKGQKAAMGVYTYYLKVIFEDGSPRHFEGSVTLLR